MQGKRNYWLGGSVLVFSTCWIAAGCFTTPIRTGEYAQGPAPSRIPWAANGPGCSYEDSLTGGQIFTMYCSYCHYAPSLAERPFSNFKNVAAHMRVRANLTGKEYAKLMEFLRRWHDIPPPTPPVTPAPSRLIFSQPMSELKPEDTKEEGAAKPAAENARK